MVTDALPKAGGSVTELSATDAWAVEPLSVMTADIGIGQPFRHNRCAPGPFGAAPQHTGCPGSN